MIPSQEERHIQSPFLRLLLTDVWDGPKSGLAVDGQGAVYSFDLIDWDDRHSVRVFSIAEVVHVCWSELRDALQSYDLDTLSEWVLPVSLPSEAEILVQRAEASKSFIAIVATKNLLSVIDVWRPIVGEVSPRVRGGWLETLGLPRSGC